MKKRSREESRKQAGSCDPPLFLHIFSEGSTRVCFFSEGLRMPEIQRRWSNVINNVYCTLLVPSGHRLVLKNPTHRNTPTKSRKHVAPDTCDSPALPRTFVLGTRHFRWPDAKPRDLHAALTWKLHVCSELCRKGTKYIKNLNDSYVIPPLRDEGGSAKPSI